MIVVRFTGGLGNQMFIYALSLIIQQRFPDEEIYADLTRYDLTKEHDGFDIQKYFSIDLKKIPNKILKNIAPVHYYVSKFHLKNLFAIGKVRHIEKINEIFEKRSSKVGIVSDLDSTNFNENIFEINHEQVNIWHYKGNWINPLYWKGYENLIRDAFVFKKNLLSSQDLQLISEMRQEQSVSIHVRRGDYKNDKRFDLCSYVYYEKAVKYILNVFREDNIKFYIFSDGEIDLSIFNDICYQVIRHSEMCGIDLYLMSKCKHNIIANSTFSYWGALLNENSKKIVVAPKYAYREKALYRKFPVPEEWIKINNISNIPSNQKLES